MSQTQQTMLATLLVVGLIIGAGTGYMLAPGTTSTDGSSYDIGYDKGYSDGYSQGVKDTPMRSSSSSLSELTSIREGISTIHTLVYGAIGASLISALAAIVVLMQVSRRIAG